MHVTILWLQVVGSPTAVVWARYLHYLVMACGGLFGCSSGLSSVSALPEFVQLAATVTSGVAINFAYAAFQLHALRFMAPRVAT